MRFLHRWGSRYGRTRQQLHVSTALASVGATFVGAAATVISNAPQGHVTYASVGLLTGSVCVTAFGMVYSFVSAMVLLDLDTREYHEEIRVLNSHECDTCSSLKEKNQRLLLENAQVTEALLALRVE